MQKVWLITGCSTGLGRALAIHVLEKGDKVVVASRNTSDVENIVNGYKDTARVVKLDVTHINEINSAVEKAVGNFGRIDVLVNNAGIGYFGALEESEDAAVRRMFDINVFGLANMCKATLPVMRKQGSGHIINIASIAGLVGFPGISYYNGTKFAVDGMSESLAKEVAHLGIKVSVVSPSGFRTDWAGRSADEATGYISDYAESAHANIQNIRNSSGKQAGDPKRAAEAIFQLTETPKPPLIYCWVRQP